MYVVFAGWNGSNVKGLETIMGQYPTLEEAHKWINVSKNDMGGCDWFHIAEIKDGRLVVVDGPTIMQFDGKMFA